MRIGSMFAGIGGLDIACERAFGARTTWQLDLVNADVRRRHWPDAVQVEADVATVDPADLARVDVLCGGFPCQDLSVAGKGAGLDGARSGLYRHMLRFVDAACPSHVVLENVPPLLKHMGRLSDDFRALGYGLSWTVCEAADAGHPHLRRRVFVLAERGVVGRGLVGVRAIQRWAPPEYEEDDAWNLAADELAEDPAWLAQHPYEDEDEDPDVWGLERERRAIDIMMEAQTVPWPTPVGRDCKSGELPKRVGAESLSAAAGAAVMGAWGKRLNPDWTEALMGYPVGWTLPVGAPLEVSRNPPAVRGRYPATWDRAQQWPGYAWEPPRTLPDGPPCPGRPARVRACGNAVCPQQATLALDALLRHGPGQADLFGAAK